METNHRNAQDLCEGKQPRAFDDCYYWNLSRVPKTIEINGAHLPHPARKSAIFVVHGIGDQCRTDTAATLRSGFEDAFDVIEKWQANNPGDEENKRPINIKELSFPFIMDGYWSNYSSLEETFKEDWKHFNERERSFSSVIYGDIVVLHFALTHGL